MSLHTCQRQSVRRHLSSACLSALIDSRDQKNSRRLWRSRRRKSRSVPEGGADSPAAIFLAGKCPNHGRDSRGIIFQQRRNLPETQQGSSDSHSLLEFSEGRIRPKGAPWFWKCSDLLRPSPALLCKSMDCYGRWWWCCQMQASRGVLSGIVSCDSAATRIRIRIVRCQRPAKRQNTNRETEARFSSPLLPVRSQELVLKVPK